jgi:SAM-dependent methyltransferase
MGVAMGLWGHIVCDWQKGIAVRDTRQGYSREQLRDCLQWDISTWKHGIYYWDAILERHRPGGLERHPPGGLEVRPPGGPEPQALELGARDGGLSLYLARKGMRVVCSDLQGPSQFARELHARHGVSGLVSYEAVNATDIPFEEGRFDVVVFKSILGGIGSSLNYGAIQAALGEMWRVLKPGGLLLFAENQRGSSFHQKARRLFVPWGKTWYYPSMAELEELLAVFSRSEIRSYGFLSCVKKDFPPFVAFDRLVCRSSSSPRHYMAFGHAVR